MRATVCAGVPLYTVDVAPVGPIISTIEIPDCRTLRVLAIDPIGRLQLLSPPIAHPRNHFVEAVRASRRRSATSAASSRIAPTRCASTLGATGGCRHSGRMHLAASAAAISTGS